MGDDYSIFSSKGGAEALRVARQLMRDLEKRLAARKTGSSGVGTVEELETIRREVADFESDPFRDRSTDPERRRHTLKSRRVVASWPPTDLVRTGVETLNELLQRPLP